jgi:hypothetical protein
MGGLIMSQFVQGPPEQVLLPRDLGQLLDQSFKVFGRYWQPLVKIGLVAAIPSLLSSLFTFSVLGTGSIEDAPMNSWVMRIALAAEAGNFGPLLSLFGGGLVFIVAMILLVPLYNGALIDVAARAVLHMEPVPLGESFRVGARRYWALLGTSILTGIIMFVAVPLLVIAGLFFLAIITLPLGLGMIYTCMMFANHAIIIEGKDGGFSALGRSYELAKFRFWPLFGFTVVLYIMVWVIQSMITVPLSFGSGIVAAISGSFAFMPVVYLVQGLVQAVAQPFLVVGKTLAYFDMRVRREAYDLEVLARQQGAQAPGTQPVTAPPPEPRV